MIQVHCSELDFFFHTLRTLMLERGIDGVIVRKEIIREGNREYETELFDIFEKWASLKK